MTSRNGGQWLVCDMDEGLLRAERTRTAAVAWLCTHRGGKVLARYTYGPGNYEYSVGAADDDATSAFIVRRDQLARCGWDPEQQPLYPVAEDPFEEVDRDSGHLEESRRHEP